MKKTEIDFSKVTHFVSEINYTRIYFDNGQNMLLPRTLKRFEENLIDHSNFIRVNRSNLVNKNFIETNDEYELKMNCGKVIPIARRRRLILV